MTERALELLLLPDRPCLLLDVGCGSGISHWTTIGMAVVASFGFAQLAEFVYNRAPILTNETVEVSPHLPTIHNSLLCILITLL